MLGTETFGEIDRPPKEHAVSRVPERIGCSVERRVASGKISERLSLFVCLSQIYKHREYTVALAQVFSLSSEIPRASQRHDRSHPPHERRGEVSHRASGQRLAEVRRCSPCKSFLQRGGGLSAETQGMNKTTESNHHASHNILYIWPASPAAVRSKRPMYKFDWFNFCAMCRMGSVHRGYATGRSPLAVALWARRF